MYTCGNLRAFCRQAGRDWATLLARVLSAGRARLGDSLCSGRSGDHARGMARGQCWRAQLEWRSAKGPGLLRGKQERGSLSGQLRLKSVGRVHGLSAGQAQVRRHGGLPVRHRWQRPDRIDASRVWSAPQVQRRARQAWRSHPGRSSWARLRLHAGCRPGGGARRVPGGEEGRPRLPAGRDARAGLPAHGVLRLHAGVVVDVPDEGGRQAQGRRDARAAGGAEHRLGQVGGLGGDAPRHG